MKKFLCAASLFIVLSAVAEAPTSAHLYPSGIKEALKAGSDLYQTLAAKFQKQVDSQPLAVQTMDDPVIVPIISTEENKAHNQVSVSAGFIDLINHLCHAKAIDRIQPGYFDRYLANLARGSAEGALPKPPNMVDARYWKDDIMNDQISNFNQIMGMLVAINLTHHYLGHMNKYGRVLAAGKLTPINGLLTADEWKASLKAGAINSFDCACTSEALNALLEGINKLPQKPAWTLYIVPDRTDLKQLTKELVHYQDLYYHGLLK
jgi:hypothetical protein